MRKEAVIEPDPIGVNQRVYSAQTISQLLRLVEMEGKCRDLVSEGIRTVQRVRERDHVVAGRKQPRRDVAA
jgi:hypothetical protein